MSELQPSWPRWVLSILVATLLLPLLAVGAWLYFRDGHVGKPRVRGGEGAR